ncbi:ribonuclease D [Providencia burhodogranariea]|uniref:Ribonuclease D n=1 Tax=Providencia burhodogranariea DSM 19968 TaxID=1141662 RepID=K8WQ52_9GAMM|nr:ribonuclease D [Providencia burhodogranariea]EKT62729.1 ribonuclease D [Providencia burhodogranariea DSM 19968]
MNYRLVTTDSELAQVCLQASETKWIALDTEFVRTRTYYPQLGLLQLYDGKQVSLIDPLSISDFSPFKALLMNKSVVKFLHAGSEDLEVFLHDFECVPDPMIDTQVLAAFLGYPISCGFATLVLEHLGIELDKSESRTDWLARPLSEKQCDYATADVLYLLPLAKMLMQKVEEAGYHDDAKEECQRMVSRRQKVVDPALAYRSITNASQLKDEQLACLQILAEWRLNQAKARDMAINFVVKEEHLWKVARYLPGSLGELDALGLTGQEIRCHGRRLLSIVEQAQKMDESEYPQPIANLNEQPQYKTLFKEIKAIVKDIAENEKFNAELLASRRQINQLLSVHWGIKAISNPPELIDGWRGRLLAEPISKLLSPAH